MYSHERARKDARQDLQAGVGHAQQRGRVSLRLLMVAELLALPLVTSMPSLILAELAAMLALSVRQRISFGLRVISLLLCIVCEGLMLFMPGQPAQLRSLLDRLTPPTTGSAAISALRAALDLAARYPTSSLASGLVLGMAKLALFALVIAWFGGHTDTSELLDFFSWASHVLPALRSPLYILSTLLAILPSIQADVRKSLDAATLRGGGRMALLWPGAWVDTLTDTIVRVVTRSERLASTAIARGFRLRDGLTPPLRKQLTGADARLVAAALLVGALTFEVIRWAR